MQSIFSQLFVSKVNTVSCFQWTLNRYISGVAMGSNLGRSFACLFVSYQEEKIFQNYPGPIPELFKRFVDDGIGAASMPRSDLEKFISFVCNFHPALQFDYQISSSCLSFLDIKLQITDNHIITSIFYKETDLHSYLQNDSSHNPKCITSIPFSELLRLRCLCSDNRHLKQDDAFNRTWWSVLSIYKLVTWQHLPIERTGGHVVLKASSCLRSLLRILRPRLTKCLPSFPTATTHQTPYNLP